MENLRAEPSDTNEIHHIMSLASSLLDDKGWYCIDTVDYILEHIMDQDKGIVFKAVQHGRIGALCESGAGGFTEGCLYGFPGRPAGFPRQGPSVYADEIRGGLPYPDLLLPSYGHGPSGQPIQPQ